MPENTKVHLASWNGSENPLDVYLAGNFDEWQSWQNKLNFNRDFVLSLIGLPEAGKWLFAGVYESKGASQLEGMYYYQLAQRASCSELAGRLVVDFPRPGRQSYLKLEKWVEQIVLHEIRPEPLRISEFPGFRMIDLSKAELDVIVRQSITSWRTALSNVSGVYLISDTKSGKLYVGSATGEAGIWQRWLDYAGNGHGGNKELGDLLKEEGAGRAAFFRYSVLEIADIHESPESILGRESHWKNILMTRQYGLNAQ